jgi:hypothetical protein
MHAPFAMQQQEQARRLEAVTCTRIRGHGGKCQAVSGWRLLEWTQEPTPKKKR